MYHYLSAPRNIKKVAGENGTETCPPSTYPCFGTGTETLRAWTIAPAAPSCIGMLGVAHALMQYQERCFVMTRP